MSPQTVNSDVQTAVCGDIHKSYPHHKATGEAHVRIDGKDVDLGEYGSPESHRRYARLIGEWHARQEDPSTRQ